ncbi:MAG: DUF5011 domain-containing protein [Verrucomicrobia bacterium]|nr:DUF5011 domain-containing protein [Verrucomicrobiota bacterium]
MSGPDITSGVLNIGSPAHYKWNPNNPGLGGQGPTNGSTFRTAQFDNSTVLTTGKIVAEYKIPRWDLNGTNSANNAPNNGISIRVGDGAQQVSMEFEVSSGGTDIRAQTTSVGTASGTQNISGTSPVSGSVVANTALVTGTQYVITELGTANWADKGAGAGASVGTVFTAVDGAATGTGTATKCLNATEMVANTTYKIISLGDTTFGTGQGVTGTPEVGLVFTTPAEATFVQATGTGKVVQRNRFPQDNLGAVGLTQKEGTDFVTYRLDADLDTGIWSTRVKVGAAGSWMPVMTDGTGLKRIDRIQLEIKANNTGSTEAPTSVLGWENTTAGAEAEFIQIDSITLGTAESFGKETASVTITDIDRVFDNTPKPVTVTTLPADLTTEVKYTGTGATTYAESTTPPTAAGTYTVTAAIDASNATYQGTATATLTIRSALAVNFVSSQITTQANNGAANKPFSVITPKLVQTSTTGKQIFGALKLDPFTPGTSSSAALSFGNNASGMKLQWNGTPATFYEGDVATALYGFRRKDFTEGMGTKTTSFAPGQDLLSAKVVFVPKGTRLASGSFRFVVEDNGQFYISAPAQDYTASGNVGSSTEAVTANALTTSWYAFNPFNLDQINPANFGTAVATPAFSNIQFIGIWIQATCGVNDGTSDSTLNYFGIQVQALSAEGREGADIGTDTTGPVLTLNGGNATLNEGEVYDDAGATALDAVDGLVDVTVTGAVATNPSGQAVAGTYLLNYSAVDTSGNASTVSRTVTVNGPPKAVNFAATQILTNKNIEYLDRPFSLATPVRANESANYTGQSIYGALKLQPASGSLVEYAGAAMSFGSNGGMKIQWNGAQGQSELGRYAENDVATGIFMFRKQEFTEGFSAKQVSFTAEEDTLKATVVFAHKDSRLKSGRVRWVVKDSGTYYISDLVGPELLPTLPTGDNAAVELTSEALSLSWNSFNPWDLNSLNPSAFSPVSLPAFANIQAIGVWLSATAGTNPGSTNKYQSLQVTHFNATVAGLTDAVVDTTPPTITLNGPESVLVALNGTYTDAGASASDLVDGIVDVITTNPVNTGVPGIYEVTYNAADASGNSATVIRTVTVNPPGGPSFASAFGGADANAIGLDGMENLLRYAFGANSATDGVVKPTSGLDADNLFIIAIVRTNDPKVSVKGESGTTLGTWNSVLIDGVKTTEQTGATLGETERQIFSVPRGGSKTFLRLKATQTP